ncbi:MAG: MBL fold metallo-hydrolase [Thermoplasmata archaeon]|nr:MBL fold metallo-hydrolase [Thermoplasmata archaeon]
MQICVLGSGSSGNATYVETEHAKILIDAGLPFRVIAARLAELGVLADQIDAIILTHAHIDHIRSVGTFERNFGTPVFAPPETRKVTMEKLGDYPWNFYQLEEKLNDLEIVSFPVPHGDRRSAGRPLNFILISKGARYAHITDLGTHTPEMLELVRGAECIHVEANYEESIVASKLRDPAHAEEWAYLEWVASSRGHLSNTQCSEFLSMVATQDTRHVFLAHLSENHTQPGKDNNSFRIARRQVTRHLKNFGLKPEIHRTYRRGATEGRKSDAVRI